MRVLVGIVVILAVLAGVGGIAHYTYDLGLAQGLAAHAGAAPGPGAAPYPVYPYPGFAYGYPWHWGFGFFGLLWPLLFIVLLFVLARRLFWRGYGWGGGPGWRGGPGHPGGGACGGGAPSWLEEWHRRAHESKGTAGTA